MIQPRKSKSLALRLAVAILAATMSVFLAILWYNYDVSRAILKKLVDENATNLSAATASRIEKVLATVAKVPENLAYYLEHSTYTEADLRHIVRAVIDKNPSIFGATVAFEPHAFEADRKFFAPYFYRSEKEIKFKDLGSKDYNYVYWDWYVIPKLLGRPLWSEPYYDEGGGGIIMSTYSVPFYRWSGGERRFSGIVTADISLKWLEEIVASVKLLETGYAFLISKNGTIITHPDEALPMNETIFSVAEQRADPTLRKLGRHMVRGETGFQLTSGLSSNKKMWLVYRPLASTGWSLGVLYPQDELFADIYKLNRVLLILGLVGVILLSTIIVALARTITRPLGALAAAAAEIATGDLEGALPPIKRKDEVGELADAFSQMRASLKAYIHTLTEATAARERIESELAIAREIQASLLPHGVQPFPDRQEFEIYATMRPAREVGGDLYDFFMVDEHHLCFLVGDVSGKGVPAALFMALTKAMLKAIAGPGVGPHEMLFRANNELCAENESCMFVTLFCAVLNIATGDLLYSSAGHNPPLYKTQGEDALFLRSAKGMAAGVLQDTEYTATTLALEPGATLVLYTDGVTESMTGRGELFSEERLGRAVSAQGDLSVEDLALAVLADVNAFSAGAPQADDITLLVLRYHGMQLGASP